MSKLSDDLEHYANEAFYRHDIKAGIKLIVEITGMYTLGALVLSALFVWLPGIGITITGSVAARFLSDATREYSNMNAEQRKQLRAVAKWINGGIKLID